MPGKLSDLEVGTPKARRFKLLNTHSPTAASRILLGAVIARCSVKTDAPAAVFDACDQAYPGEWDDRHRAKWNAQRNRLMIQAGWPAALVRGGLLSEIAEALISRHLTENSLERAEAADPDLRRIMPASWHGRERHERIWSVAVGKLSPTDPKAASS